MTSPPPDDPLVFRFFNEIGIIEQLSRAQFERGLPHGLTMAQFRILNHFARLGGERTPLELARAFQVTKGAVTNALRKLESKGFVEVRADTRDRRSKRVRLTAAGARARNDAVATLQTMLPALLDAFPEADFEQALPFLQRLRMFLDAYRDEAADDDASGPF